MEPYSSNSFSAPNVNGHEAALAGFNCVFAAGALGGVFILPNRNGILFSIAGVVIIGFVSVATNVMLKPLELPPLAFPFAVSTILLLWPFRLGIFRGIYLYPLAYVGTAEANLRQYWRWVRRLGRSATQLRLPHYGSWTVTQESDSLPTHTGIGKHAFDFMLLDSDLKAASSVASELTDYFGYGMPVLAPAAGTVAALVTHLADNPPQGVETEFPFGNYVSIYHAPGEYSLLAHLQQNSVKVTVGQPVTAGQEIGRVGNSGRSPEPHCHLQLQSEWYPGANSIPSRWSGLLAKRTDGLVYLAERNPKLGDLLSDFFAANPIRLEDYFPFSVLGAEWTYSLKQRVSSHSHVKLQVRPGMYGRFLLDDGDQIWQATRTSAHWQLEDLDETDPDYRGHGKKGLLALFGPALACLPFFFGTNFKWEFGVSGYMLASPIKRLLELHGYGTAYFDGYKLIPDPGGLSLLELNVRIVTESNREFHYHLIFRPGAGLVSATMTRNKSVVAELSLQKYSSRLYSWEKVGIGVVVM